MSVQTISIRKEKMRPVHSPTIRSRYDYFYNMLPATLGQGGVGGGMMAEGAPVLVPGLNCSNFYDNQQADLFGDPIPPPPPTGFVDNYESELMYDPGGGRSPSVQYHYPSSSPAHAQHPPVVVRARSAVAHDYRSPSHHQNHQ